MTEMVRELTRLLGSHAYDAQGARRGRVVDLVVGWHAHGRAEEAEITAVVLAERGGVCRAPWSAVSSWTGRTLALRAGTVLDAASSSGPVPLAEHELLLRRDVLDSSVVAVDRARRAVVSEVLLSTPDDAPWQVVGLDVGARGVLRRLLPRRLTRAARADVLVPGELHLTSPRGHTIQLRSPAAAIYRLDGPALADLLTRLSPAHATEVARAVDMGTAVDAFSRLHPAVQERLANPDRPVRRLSRLKGWRLWLPSGPSVGSNRGHGG